ncbi:hypothetical protein D6821_01110 [Candidatus Parcubacteria bacterium]|nr:MAG: hypothetical protein D6821_01110 [Candidatus Parcubacteria bacterium]
MIMALAARHLGVSFCTLLLFVLFGEISGFVGKTDLLALLASLPFVVWGMLHYFIFKEEKTPDGNGFALAAISSLIWLNFWISVLLLKVGVNVWLAIMLGLWGALITALLSINCRQEDGDFAFFLYYRHWLGKVFLTAQVCITYLGFWFLPLLFI